MKVRFLALLALVLGLASCQKDTEGFDVAVNGEVSTTVTVNLADASGTRAGETNSANSAIANGVVADTNYTLRYILQVFDEDGATSKDMVVKHSDESEVSFDVRLVPNRHYNFVVWADIVKTNNVQEGVIGEGLHYTIGRNLKEISLKDDTWVAMDETRDAYTGVYSTKKEGQEYTATSSINLTLTRPFAKLRVVTTDMAELFGGVEPAKATVTYGTKHRTTFNALTQLAGDADTSVSHTFEYDDVFAYGDNNDNNKVLFTDYFFAANQDDVVKFVLDVKEADGTPIRSTNFNTDIPVKRNYLTTITGNVLTDGNHINVTIVDRFDGYHNAPVVNTTEALEAAVANAKNGDIIFIDGEVTMPYFTDKALTFAGIGNKAIVKQSPATHIDAFYAGATLNFENLTLVGESYQNNTQGYQKAVKETYKNCHFVNYIMFAGDVTTVTDCTFENEGQYFWTGTADNITFTNCEFEGVERAVKVCTVGNAGARTVTFNDCQFTATTQVKSAIEIDGSKGSSYVVNINGCTATGFNVSGVTGESLFNIEGAENVKVYIDGNEWIEKGVVKDENGNYVVNSLTTLETALEAAGAAGAGNTTIVFAENAQLNMTGVAWTPINVDGYNGADIVTIEGNGAVITGLTTPLFAGGFAGGSGIVIKDLTIKDSNIVSANTIGSGAFIESVDSMAKIELTNCHLLNSTVTGGDGSRTGGLIGWTAGYNNVNDGPVKTYVTIDGCSVVGCTITCDGSVGGINGHAGNNDWTYTTITNCTVKNNTLASTDDGAWRVGVVVGTANVGEVTISNITESGNTLTQTDKTAPVGFKRNLYGRAVLGATGKLTIDGYKYVAEGQFEAENGDVVVNSAEGLNAAMKNDATVVIGANIENATIKLPATLNDFTLLAAEGVVLKNSTISAADGNAYNYENLTFDGITFDNSRIVLTGRRNGEEVIKNLTVTNCVFKNLDDDSNTAPVHINKDASEAVENFTFTNNVINGATGGSKSGVYAQLTGKVVFENNVINNVSFRPYVIQITTDDSITDTFTVKNNTFSGSSVGRAQGFGNNASGTDAVEVVVSGNIFKGITEAQQICYWIFNPETTTADLSKNYYDIDIEANPSRIYYNSAANSVEDLKAMGVYPFYTELNADGTINLNSLKQAE